MKSDLDCEGAGAVMGGWMEHAPNAASVPGRDFKKLNRMALVQGSGSNTAQIAEFRRHHDARLHTGHGHKQVSPCPAEIVPCPAEILPVTR